MIVHADWVLPMCVPPIRDGAVHLRGDSIIAVGTLDELVERYPKSNVNRHDGCVLLPGLVNAHSHLALTVLNGLIPSAPFHEWIPQAVRAMRALDDDDMAAATALGAAQALLSGTTVVGDIVYGPESACVAADMGLGGTFFWEVLGISPSELSEHLEQAEYPSDPARRHGGRVRYGLSPHSPYTSGPDLIRAVHTRAISQQAGFAIHAAESPAEVELVNSGTGPLAATARRSAKGFSATGATPVRYLAELGVLDDALAIHCAETLPADIPLLKQTAGVALCPRSNAFLHVGPAPAQRLERAGVRLALGTDSLASNEDLDLFAEARALRAIAPALSARRLIEMMTVDGAAALGLSGRFGTLEPGAYADLALFCLKTDDRVYESLLKSAGRQCVRAVMSAGVWRVRAGQSTFSDATVDAASKRAAQKAAAALEYLT